MANDKSLLPLPGDPLTVNGQAGTVDRVQPYTTPGPLPEAPRRMARVHFHLEDGRPGQLCRSEASLAAAVTAARAQGRPIELEG